MGNLIKMEYPFLMKETLRGQTAINAAAACHSAALIYVVTLLLSLGCLFAGKPKRTTAPMGAGGGVGAPMRQ